MKRFVVIETLRNGPAVLDRETGLREPVSKELIKLLDRKKVDLREPSSLNYQDQTPLSESIKRGSEGMKTYYSFARRGWQTRKYSR